VNYRLAIVVVISEQGLTIFDFRSLNSSDPHFFMNIGAHGDINVNIFINRLTFTYRKSLILVRKSVFLLVNRWHKLTIIFNLKYLG